MKKYQKIIRHGKTGTDKTVNGKANIVIMEKLDGANASFTESDGKLKCFSRNQELTDGDTLRGFSVWATEAIEPKHLLDGYVYFGEWLVKHKLNYGENEKQFYLFDIYDEYYEKYVPIETVKAEATRLGLNMAPIFYEGPFKGFDHVQEFVGKSELGEVGEGVVIKNYDYKNRGGEQMFTKVVSDTFAEKAQVKKQRVPQSTGGIDEFVATFLTKARVEKTISKLVDQGIIDENYGIEDTGTVLKHSASQIAEDIIEEEIDELVKTVKKRIGKKYPEKVREVLSERSM